MLTGNCTRIEKSSKCYLDVNKFLIVGLLRPKNKKRFCRKSEHLYWKIILSWDVSFNFTKFRLILKMWKDVSKTILCTSTLKLKWTCHKSFPQTAFWGHSKSASLAERHFVNASPPMSHFATFCPLCRLWKVDGRYKAEAFFLYMAVAACYISKNVKKKNSLLHINTPILTNRVEKMLEFNALDHVT